ncbi:MAG: lamin tail domain-containing protein [Bacteroidales bacterium]|nr:lamin tail domain-containing protein [Bacteroidales bacterium]
MGIPRAAATTGSFFFLASDHKGFDEKTNHNSAIIFGVNYTGHDDHLKLWQLSDGNALVIIDTGLDYQEQIGTAGEPLFRITRLPTGQWEVAWQLHGDPDALQILGEGVEIEKQTGKYMGFRYSYSSAQDRKLWLDDISVRCRFYRDTISPRVTRLRILGLDGLEIQYNEPVSREASGRYRWNGMAPDSLYLSPGLHRLFFNAPFPNRITQELHITGMSDPEGNAMGDTLVHFRQDLAAFGDVVINEIMTDPDPAVYLPHCEFLELYNRYVAPIDLNAWQLEVNGRAYELLGTSLQPGGFVVLTHTGCHGMYGSVAQQSALTSATALVNGGASIRLLDQYGRLIHCLDYEEMKRYGEAKTEGGWSLERADPDNLCGGAENWYISADTKGGTPGEVNSHRFSVRDFSPPCLEGVGIPSNDRISVVFDEHVLILQGDPPRFLLDENPVIQDAGNTTYAGREVLLNMEHSPDSSTRFTLTLENISDCAGNVARDQAIPLKWPSFPAPGMPVINEIMYDPLPGGSDYIELYNQGDRYFDLYDLQLEIREPGSVTGSTVPLMEDSRLLFPGQYVVLCRHEWVLRDEWIPGDEATVIGLDGWRKLPAGGACIRLTDRSGNSIDQVCYHDSMHHDQLQVTAGVSLERIDPDCTAGTQCWASAAASENHGTPGSMNSQATAAEETGPNLELTPKVFSPDGDGVDDILLISSGSRVAGGIMELYVTDLSGNFIRQIATRGIAGTGDHFYWDGEDQQERMVLPGMYVIHQRSVSNTGSRMQREACAVIYR